MRKFYWTIIIAVIISNSGNAQTFSLLKDINPGAAGSSPASVTSINDEIFFSSDNGVNGQEFWKTDGTPEGTVMIKDINPGPGSSSPTSFYIVNGIIYFMANDGVHGFELWKTDGTEAGTVMVKDVNPGINSSTPAYFVNLNDNVYFVADDGTHGNEMWRSNGTTEGTLLVKDITVGPNSSFYNTIPFVVLNGFVYFLAVQGPGIGYLWKSDGTAAGTVIVHTVTSAIMKNINNTLIFNSGGTGAQLWKSDGTTAGTEMIINTGSQIKEIVEVNGTIYFYNGTDGGSGSNLRLWKSDATTAGTVVVKQIPFTVPYTVGKLTQVNDKLFFIAPHPTGGSELWKSDGTDAGTNMVKDILTGTGSSSCNYLTNASGELYFSSTDGVNGHEIWKSNGTESGTVMVQNIADPGDGSPSGFIVAGSKLFVSVADNVNGRELWVADLNLVLPVTLSDFRGQLSGDDGLLTWKTYSEQNTSHFEIERSTDGRNFIKAGMVNASGNSSATKQYSYTDRNITSLSTPVVYYRLKMNDADGVFTYSRIIAVNVGSKEPVIMFYPSPARDIATLMIAAVKKEEIKYTIIDQLGRVIQQKNINLNEGSNMITVETNSLTSGVYTISVNGNIMRSSVKFIKQ